MSTWMVPEFINVSYASGTVASCTVQGFFGYLFYLLSTLSNASLAIAYCLVVKLGWTDGQKDRARPYFLVPPVALALVLAVVPLPFQAYNYNGGFFCDISTSPVTCDWPGSAVECERGTHARLLLVVVGIVPFFTAFVVVIAAMALLVWTVLAQERRMDRYRVGGEDRTMTNQTARHGMYYILAFGVAWIPWYIYAIVESRQRHIPEALAVTMFTTRPLQGVFNSLVYFRPKYKADRASNPAESSISSVLRVLNISHHAAGCSGCCRRAAAEEETLLEGGG